MTRQLRRFPLLALVLAMLSAWMALPSTSSADVVPDSTRFALLGDASWSTVVTFPASGDTTVWIGFEAWSGQVTRLVGDCIVDPLEVGTRTLTDDGASSRRIYANPRVGDPAILYGPDTLSVSSPTAAFCCGGVVAVKLTGQGTAGRVRLQVTAVRQGVPLGSAGGGGGGAVGLIWEQMTSAEKPDTALSVDQIVYPEDLAIMESVTGTAGVTLTAGTPWPSNGYDTREAMVAGLYLSWANDFTDSILVIVRGGPTLDAAVHAGIDLNPAGDAPIDSMLAYVKDNGGTGGYAFLPLVDHAGSSIWAPYMSFSFNKVGAGNVTTFRATHVWRRLR